MPSPPQASAPARSSRLRTKPSRSRTTCTTTSEAAVVVVIIYRGGIVPLERAADPTGPPAAQSMASFWMLLCGRAAARERSFVPFASKLELADVDLGGVEDRGGARSPGQGFDHAGVRRARAERTLMRALARAPARYITRHKAVWFDAGHAACLVLVPFSLSFSRLALSAGMIYATDRPEANAVCQ